MTVRVLVRQHQPMGRVHHHLFHIQDGVEQPESRRQQQIHQNQKGVGKASLQVQHWVIFPLCEQCQNGLPGSIVNNDPVLAGPCDSIVVLEQTKVPPGLSQKLVVLYSWEISWFPRMLYVGHGEGEQDLSCPGGGRETERETERDRERERQRDRQTDRQTERDRERQRETESHNVIKIGHKPISSHSGIPSGPVLFFSDCGILV